MISTTSAFNTANAKLTKRPIYVFVIGGQTTVYSTHDLTAMGITGAPAFAPWLKVPSGSTQSIDVQGGTSSIGEMQCEVVDIGGAVRTLVGTTTLEGSSATLLVGYPGTAYSDFAVLNVFTLYKVVPGRDYSSYAFSSRDVQMDAKQTVWSHPINGYPLSVNNPWIIQGTPGEIVIAVLMMGLGFDASRVDVAGILALQADSESFYGSTRPYLFRETAPFQAKDFIENEIMKSAGMYPVVLNTGQYSVRGCRAPGSGPSPVFAFTQDNVTVLPQYDRAPILNDLLWSMDIDSSGSYQTTLLYLDATSISQFQRSNERQVQSSGLRSELGGQTFAQNISQRMFARFAGTTGLRGGAPKIKLDAFFMSLPVWVGDYVSLSHPKMPDLFTGDLGVSNRIFEVIDRTPDYANGKMQYTLLDTGLTGAAAAPVIGTALIGSSNIY
ncbi:MAG TPA: hypothetical protein VG273_11755 [Bryobacteraceae bacterium]|jgi:hypothetical protein|nr:hypothetical protein [Bryobacteraceae bacterium]